MKFIKITDSNGLDHFLSVAFIERFRVVGAYTEVRWCGMNVNCKEPISYFVELLMSKEEQKAFKPKWTWPWKKKK